MLSCFEDHFPSTLNTLLICREGGSEVEKVVGVREKEKRTHGAKIKD